jgi:hypothetical protein
MTGPGSKENGTKHKLGNQNERLCLSSAQSPELEWIFGNNSEPSDVYLHQL